MPTFDPGVLLAALLLTALGGAALTIPFLGYGPLAAVSFGLVLGTAAIESLAEHFG